MNNPYATHQCPRCFGLFKVGDRFWNDSGTVYHWSCWVNKGKEKNTAIDLAKATPPKAEKQEPVALDPLMWTPCVKLPIVVHVRQQRAGEAHVSTREGITPVKPDDLIMRGVSGEEYPIGRKIFEQTYTLDITTAPPKREWQGLTDEEIVVCGGMDGADNWVFEFANALQIKLRKKNHG